MQKVGKSPMNYINNVAYVEQTLHLSTLILHRAFRSYSVDNISKTE